MNILVTGGAGFIGSHLCKKLIEGGDRVFCLDNLHTGSKENIANLIGSENFSFIEHDVIRPIAVRDSIDQIYNLACPASPFHYQKDPIQTIKTSVIGTINVLELAKEKGATVLQASTSEVYGDPHEHPQKETYFGNVNPIGPRACYDEGKRCAETLFFDYARSEGVKIRVVRIFNTYGPNMHPDDGRVVSNFIVRALKGESLTVYGDGSQTRSFQYIDDLVEGIVRMMNNRKDIVGPVNLGNPEEHTVKAIANIVLSLIPESKSGIAFGPFPPDDPMHRRPHISLAKKELGWEPKIPLEEGIKRTVEYFKMMI